MIRTQIQLTKEQAKKVKKIANSKGIAMAEVIREAVDEAIRSKAGTVSEERRARAIEIAGKFRSGKKDVSKRHDAYLAKALNK